MGTTSLLEASLKFHKKNKLKNFLFHHVSTDEVYGDLEENKYKSFYQE